MANQTVKRIQTDYGGATPLGWNYNNNEYKRALQKEKERKHAEQKKLPKRV